MENRITQIALISPINLSVVTGTFVEFCRVGDIYKRDSSVFRCSPRIGHSFCNRLLFLFRCCKTHCKYIESFGFLITKLRRTKL